MQRFRCLRSLLKFVAVHFSVFNYFNQDRTLSSRDHFKQNLTAALAEYENQAAAIKAIAPKIGCCRDT